MSTLYEAHRAVLRRAAWGLWGGVGFVAGVLLLRGISGAFTREITPLAACCGSALAVVVSLAGFACRRLSKIESPAPSRFWQDALLTILPPAILGVILAPSSSSAGMAWVTILAIGSSVAVYWGKTSPSEKITFESEDADGLDSVPIPSPPEASQWMARRLIEEGGETWDQIEGRITVEFAVGQQHATAHLAICPPMAGTPEIECEVLSDADMEWKAAAIFPYGVRLELRRPRPATEAARIPLGYTIAAFAPSEMEKAA